MESVHDISEGFLTYDDRKDIDAHKCLIDIIELYSNHIVVHLNASKERLLEEYKKKYELKDMHIARITRPQATSTSSTPPPAQYAPSETFRERAYRLFNDRRRSHVNQRHHYSHFCETSLKRAVTPTQHLYRLSTIYKTQDDPRSHIYFRMGGVHATIPVQQSRQQNVKTQKSPKRHQVCGVDICGVRPVNVNGRQAHRKIHNPTILSRNDRENQTV